MTSSPGATRDWRERYSACWGVRDRERVVRCMDEWSNSTYEPPKAVQSNHHPSARSLYLGPIPPSTHLRRPNGHRHLPHRIHIPPKMAPVALGEQLHQRRMPRRAGVLFMFVEVCMWERKVACASAKR